MGSEAVTGTVPDVCFWRWRFQPVWGFWGHLGLDYSLEDPAEASSRFLLRHVDYGLPGDRANPRYQHSIARYVGMVARVASDGLRFAHRAASSFSRRRFAPRHARSVSFFSASFRGSGARRARIGCSAPTATRESGLPSGPANGRPVTASGVRPFVFGWARSGGHIRSAYLLRKDRTRVTSMTTVDCAGRFQRLETCRGGGVPILGPLWFVIGVGIRRCSAYADVSIELRTRFRPAGRAIVAGDFQSPDVTRTLWRPEDARSSLAPSGRQDLEIQSRG